MQARHEHGHPPLQLLPAVRAAIDELHAAGVRVLIPYNPWDIGTRRCGAGGTCGGSENTTNATAVCN
eukprot:COSAG01_NODE_62286_length_285_cov_1.037634_1_plen_66_part_01